MKCGEHTEAETSLRCGKCGKLICPRCMVQTPVGARCAECAQVRRLPVFCVSPVYYLRGAVAGVGMALAGGFLWALVDRLVPFIYLDLLFAGIFGYALGEVMSLAVNRKQSRGLAVMACACVAVGYIVKLGFSAYMIFGLIRIGLDFLALVVGMLTAVRPFRRGL